MNALNFETGIVTYSINGKHEVHFNPTDSFFVERLFDAFDTLDARQDAYKADVDAAKGTRQIFEIARKRDAEMREIIDGVLGEGAADAIFDSMNVYALADGLPVWTSLLLALMDEVDTSFAREQKTQNPRVLKYTQRYKQK